MSNEGDADLGLTEASTNDLRQLVRALTEGTLAEPLTIAKLSYLGLGHLARPMAPFIGLGPEPILGALRAVLAERSHVTGRRLDLVWSGADSGTSYARQTRIVVPELIDQARSQLTIAGYSFDEGTDLFHHLHTAMQERGVLARFFLDVHQLSERLRWQLIKDHKKARLEPLVHARKEGSAAFAREVLSVFRELHWPFTEPPPALYYDPRTAEEKSFASLHAKCLIVDVEHVLVTSANFTGRGHDRNIEVGILVHDVGYAGALEQQWNNLVASGDVVLG